MSWGTNYVNYQERAAEFSVGDEVYPALGSDDTKGRVTAVWPAIGMVDVEYPDGNRRFPVEDLQRASSPPLTNSAPGGGGTVSVPGGPVPSSAKVVQAFLKRSVYWADRDRKYRATRPEIKADMFTCPRCKDVVLKKAIYKRTEGVSVRLLGCPSCMFLVKRDDLAGCG